MGIGGLEMNMHNKSIVALAINALAISSQNESTFTIKNHKSDLVDAPVTIDNLNSSGKRGKKGKSLKDWH